jgi:hypothetical protein
MKRQNFSLKPFKKDPSLSIEINGSIARHNNTLLVYYELAGNLQTIYIPERKQAPSRVKGLWENTCFELFVAAKDSDRYWEINISPSGDWNVFRFDHYEGDRCIDNLEEEGLVASFASATQKNSGLLSVDFEFDLDGIIRENKSLDIGISAVVKSVQKSYWALAHCDSVPNFHRRDSFKLKL